MKKFKLFALAVCAMLSTNAYAGDTDATVGIWKINYTKATPTDGVITGFKNDITAAEVKDLVIPATLNDAENKVEGIKIITIGTGAALSTAVMDAIETIDFTEATNLTTIGVSAFEGAEALTSVKFGGALTTISASAFKGATSLATIDFSAAVKLDQIGNYAFGGATATTLDFSKCAAMLNFTKGGATAPFLSADETMNSYVTTVTLHANTTNIGTAFAYMNLLTTINLSSTKLATIEDKAFTGDASLTALTTPATLTDIKKTPFQGCIRLATLNIDATLLKNFGTAATELFGTSTSALKTLNITNDFKTAASVINVCLANQTKITTVNIAAGKEFAPATVNAGAIAVAENAEITLGKVSVSPAGLFKGPGAAKKIKSLTIGDINVDLSAGTTIVTTAIIETATVGKIGNKFRADVLGQAAKIVFAGDITTNALTATATANTALTEVDFGTVAITAAYIAAGTFDETAAPNLTTVSWEPATATAAFAKDAFGSDTAANLGFEAPKVSLNTTAAVAGKYENDESNLYNVNFGSAGVTTTKLEPKNGLSGATSFYAKFYAPTAAEKYTIDKTNGDATVVCYEAYVDASDANIYMLPMSIIDGKYYLVGKNPVIVKSSSTAEIEASKCNATDAADKTLNSQNFKQTGAATYGPKNEIKQTNAIAGATLMSDLDKSYYALAKFEKYGLLWKTFKTTTQLPDNTFFVVTAASAADRLNIIWLDEDNATAIQSFKKKVEAGQIYNLRGEKVNGSYKGIVIKDGKKYIQK